MGLSSFRTTFLPILLTVSTSQPVSALNHLPIQPTLDLGLYLLPVPVRPNFSQLWSTNLQPIVMLSSYPISNNQEHTRSISILRVAGRITAAGPEGRLG